MKRYVIILLAFLIGACVGHVATEERDYRQQVDYENWKLCMMAYEQSGVVTLHVNHSQKQHKPGHWSIRTDLGTHSCRRVLGIYWTSY